MELYFVVEGQTEESFVAYTLRPHLERQGLHVYKPIIVETSPGHKGGGHWKSWKNDISRLLQPVGRRNMRVTTLFDLYGLPADFPGIDRAGNEQAVTRVVKLQEAMSEVVRDNRFIPYLQLHEFESLVLAVPDRLDELLDSRDDMQGLRKLQEQIQNRKPEEINGGAHTAPSKRIEKLLPGYSKFLHGPAALESAGIETLKTKCPRFGAWVTSLEALSSLNL